MIGKLKPKSEFSRNTLTLMAGTAIAQAIPLALTPILTRIYSPSEFGVLAIYMALVSILSVIATGRYELAIMLPSQEKDSANLFILSMLIACCISIILFIIIFSFKKNILLLLGIPNLGNWLYLVPISILLTSAHQTLTYWNNRKKHFKLLASNRVYYSGSLSFGQLLLGLLSAGFSGLISGELLGRLISIAHLVKASKDNLFKIKNYFDISNIKLVMKNYQQFPIYDIPASLLSVGVAQSPSILLTLLFSPVYAGFFYLTQRILQAPITLISGAVLDVFKITATEDYLRDGNAKKIYLKTFLALIVMGSTPTIVLYFTIESVFLFLFGEEWKVAGEYAKILLPALLLRFVANPLSFILYITEKQHINLIGMIVLLVLVSFFSFTANSHIELITGISISYSFIYGAYIILSGYYAGVLR